MTDSYVCHGCFSSSSTSPPTAYSRETGEGQEPGLDSNDPEATLSPYLRLGVAQHLAQYVTCFVEGLGGWFRASSSLWARPAIDKCHGHC